MDAVLVPASASRTSQSTVTVRSPRRSRSVTLLSALPISRWISCVRPPGRPRFTSRPDRSRVDAGSIEYSPVTHPRPVPRSHRGRSSDTVAAHSTRVLPMEHRTDPFAHPWYLNTYVTGRISPNAPPYGTGHG